MDENMNNTNATETAPDWDDWDSLEFPAESEDAPAEEAEDGADQTVEAETEGAETEGEENAADEAEGTDQTFTLKHMDETRTVSRDEVIALAQKGMDYDRIRQKLDQTTEQLNSTSDWEESAAFVKELADRQRMTVTELIDKMRADILARDEGIDVSVAMGRIQNQKERAALERERNAIKTGNAEDAARSKAIQAFIEAYPDVKAENVPKTVWDEFARTGDLVGAYRAEENRQLKQQVEELNQKLTAKEQNTKNKGRSTGSQKTEGKGEEDAFRKAWYDGT